MEQSNYVTAIDIGTTKIAAIIGKVTPNGRVLIEELHCTYSRGVRRGVVENVEDTVVSIKECLAELYKKLDLRQERVIVGIAGRHISGIQNSAQVIRKNPKAVITEKEVSDLKRQMYSIVLSPGQEILQVITQDYTIDGEPVQKAVGCQGNVLIGYYYIVISDAAAVERIRMCINRCGLTLDNIILEPIASAEAVLTGEEKENGTALLDIGGGTSDLVIYYKNIVRAAVVLPCGGELITEDIRDAYKISRQMAERLKCSYGSCFEDCCSEDVIIPYYKDTARRETGHINEKNLAGVIRDRMEQIIEAVNHVICESGFEDKISSIVLTGGGSLMRHLPQLFRLRTGLDVRIGYPRVQRVAGSKSPKLSPIMATGVGLMMNGYADGSGGGKIGGLIGKWPLVKKFKGKVQNFVEGYFTEENDPHRLY
ncbi:MAG: cell division protein FtsA [Prevotellaceae bacterium]|jgi:cell division protein FtsA|nr:cell division protein FtsA [Prevotellaceae bacterium]